MGRGYFPWIDTYVGMLIGHEAMETLWCAALGGLCMKTHGSIVMIAARNRGQQVQRKSMPTLSQMDVSQVSHTYVNKTKRRWCHS